MSAVDALRRGRLREADLAVKNPVRVATVLALPAYTRTGNVILADANGALPTIDLVALAVGNSMLLLHGASGVDNGPWVCDSLGSAGSKFQFTRRWDASASEHFFDGMTVPVSEGEYNADTAWILTTSATITLNTTALVFREHSVRSVLRGLPIQEDFVGGSAGTTSTVGEHGWSFSSSGTATCTQIAGETGHVGIRRITTGVTGTSVGALYLSSSATLGPIISGDIDEIAAIFRPAPLLDIADATIQVGFSNDQNVDAATERCVIELNVASAFWQAISEVAAGTETTVTSVTATANTWYVIRIKRDASTGNWLFYINGALVATHSTRKPSTAGVMLVCRLLQRTAAVETCDLDSFELWPRTMTRH